MQRSVKILVIAVMIGIIGFLGYSKIRTWHTKKLETAVKKEQQIGQEKADNLSTKVFSLEEEITALKGQEIPKEKLAEAFGQEVPKEKLVEAFGQEASDGSAVVTPGKRPLRLAEVERQILSLFSYLDSRDYIRAFKLSGDTYYHYQEAVTKLSQNRPIVVGEMDSLYNTVRNVAHFFRVIGKKEANLVKAVMRNESEISETMMKIFFTWYTMNPADRLKIKGCPSVDVLYQYAGFFLETLGGRSYLFRRDSRTRTLTYYYCVLIVDRANDEQLNAFGIDIRPHVRSSLNQISNQIGFIYQKDYIAKLEDLSGKYRIKNDH